MKHGAETSGNLFRCGSMYLMWHCAHILGIRDTRGKHEEKMLTIWLPPGLTSYSSVCTHAIVHTFQAEVAEFSYVQFLSFL